MNKLGRAFLRFRINLLRIPSAQRNHHHFWLNTGFRADVHWWAVFAKSCNGVAFVPVVIPETVTVTFNASGMWGCGAWSANSWFQWQWPAEARDLHIAFKELLGRELEGTVDKVAL